jgi:hypothetical protein
MPLSRAAISVQASVSGRVKPYPSRPRSYKLRCRIASSPIKSQRRSTRLRCDSIRFQTASIASHSTRYKIRYDSLWTAPCPTKSQRKSVRLRCDSIRFRSDFYGTPRDPLFSHIWSHPDRIEPDQQSTAVYTVAMRFYNIPIRRLYTSQWPVIQSYLIAFGPHRARPNVKGDSILFLSDFCSTPNGPL